MSLARGALVIGASGLVGRALMQGLRRTGVRCAGTYAAHAVEGWDALDITRREQVRNCLDRVRPGAVFLTAALTHLDFCQEHRSEAFRINVEGPRIVASEAASFGAKLIFYSSDYAFDGRAGPYDEEAPPAPLSVYGETKAEAEQLVLALGKEPLVLRTTVVYGWQFASKNFAMQVFDRVRAGEIMNVAGDQWGNPTLADDLADGSIDLAERGTTGIVNVVGGDLMARSEFARALVRLYGGDPGRVVPVSTESLRQAAPRPLRGGLRSQKFARITGREAISLDSALDRLRRKIGKTKDMTDRADRLAVLSDGCGSRRRKRVSSL